MKDHVGANIYCCLPTRILTAQVHCALEHKEAESEALLRVMCTVRTSQIRVHLLGSATLPLRVRADDMPCLLGSCMFQYLFCKRAKAVERGRARERASMVIESHSGRALLTQGLLNICPSSPLQQQLLGESSSIVLDLSSSKRLHDWQTTSIISTLLPIRHKTPCSCATPLQSWLPDCPPHSSFRFLRAKHIQHSIA
eukprot:1721090-Amphidinium_carterae.1